MGTTAFRVYLLLDVSTCPLSRRVNGRSASSPSWKRRRPSRSSAWFFRRTGRTVRFGTHRQPRQANAEAESDPPPDPFSVPMGPFQSRKTSLAPPTTPLVVCQVAMAWKRSRVRVSSPPLPVKRRKPEGLRRFHFWGWECDRPALTHFLTRACSAANGWIGESFGTLRAVPLVKVDPNHAKPAPRDDDFEDFASLKAKGEVRDERGDVIKIDEPHGIDIPVEEGWGLSLCGITRFVRGQSISSRRVAPRKWLAALSRRRVLTGRRSRARLREPEQRYGCSLGA